MLSFFRKHQKFFFLFVIIIVVTTFVFFGAFQAIGPSLKTQEATAFKTSEGRSIKESYLNDMTRFLASEPLTRRGFHNFLNDQVITKDIFDAHMGSLLLEDNKERIEKELEERSVKEKNYRPYCHPVKKELSAENVWLAYARPLYTSYNDYKKSLGSTAHDSFEKKVDLFLMERHFPADFLAYILRSQEKSEREQDPRLLENLSLFGYKDLTDWFGPTYIENVSKAIIRAASFARAKGYKVSQEEISAEILFKSQQWFQQIKKQSHQWPNAQALYRDCLRFLQMDEARLMAILEDILLFRHLFQDQTGINCVDSYSLKRFFSKAHECVEVELTTLPGEYHFTSAEELKKFEVYLQGVAVHRDALLDLPERYDTIENIEKRAPELLASPYFLEMTHTSKKECQAKVTLKETWKWQGDHKTLLRAQFPDIGSLDNMSSEEKVLVDAFTRAKIVEQHPEWILENLASKKKEEKKVIFPKSFLEGIVNPQALSQLLEKEDQLIGYTQDNENFYTIRVKERFKKEVLTFKEARDSQMIEKMMAKNENSAFCDALFQAIYSYAKPLGLIEHFSKDACASLRFVRYMNEVKNKTSEEHKMWPLAKKREEIYRFTRSHISFEEACALETSSFLHRSDTLGLFFIKHIDHRVENPMPLERMLVEERWLSEELKRDLLKKILHG